MQHLAQKYEIVCLAPKDDFTEKLPYQFIDLKMNNQSTNPFQDITLFFRLLLLFKNLKPDLILSYTIKLNIYGSLCAHILKIPIIITVAGLGTTFRKKGMLAFIIRKLYQVALPFADYIFFQNKDDQKLISNLLKLNNKKTGLVAGSGVNTDWFVPQSMNSDEKFRFLFLGRLLKEKGIVEYVEAAQKILSQEKNVEFQVLGFADVENPTAISQQEIEEWEKEKIIHYLGSTDDVRIFIAKADCIVLPSYYGEGIPRSLLEAASMEKPIITTDNVGCREVVIDGKNGLICRQKNVQDLQEKMKIMMNFTARKRHKMGKFSRKKMQKEFDEKNVIAEIEQVLEFQLKNNNDHKILTERK